MEEVQGRGGGNGRGFCGFLRETGLVGAGAEVAVAAGFV